MEDLRSYLRAGCTKTTFGTQTDRLLSKLSQPEQRKEIKIFQKVFRLSLNKLEGHPAYDYYKAARIFDPRQLPIMGHDISDFANIPGLVDPTPELLEEWLI